VTGGPPKPTDLTPYAAPPPQAAAPSTEFLAQLVANQAKANANQAKANELHEKELELQQYQAETERKKIDHAQEYSLKALDAQLLDRQEERVSQSKTTMLSFWILLPVVPGILGIAWYALYANKEQFIIEVLKYLATFAGGGGVGYFFAHKKAARSTDSPEGSAP